MLQSDADNYFQTSNSVAEQKRRQAKADNKNGNPVVLTSKILAIHADDQDPDAVYIAEAAGTARRVVLETGDKSTVYTGAAAPLTSITTLRSPSAEPILFAACWDKTIHSWNLRTRKPIRRYTGHSDFVKCVLATEISGTPVLLSGSADSSIIVWNVETGRKIHTLKGHARAVLDLALDPAKTTEDELFLFSADTVRDILRWKITLDSAGQMLAVPLRVHETSVNRLRFEDSLVVDAEDADADADLWTASSDKTAQRLVRSRDWASDTTLSHPDFVRDIVIDQQAGWVITACRDEEVRVWGSSSGKLACVFSGHFNEVTGLALMPPAQGSRASRVVSVSIDGTLRVWTLDPAEMKKAQEEYERLQQGIEVEAEPEVKKESMLTAEEEAELAELMDSDDE
ncbi:WD40 repeat-like protein [Aureobasidium pullulans]|uniref:WD40 repeat-like protein n=1 Tax=Aureobasidium pullulans TaxID=5580 RepID=A0A4S9EEZ6_AURPU|nr:WD40 repeat-like protein [Aureobasidium pullulans]